MENVRKGMKMIIEVTQYMRPCGRQVQHQLEISDDCKEKYQDILDCSVRLTAEQLITGVVSQTISTSDFDFDICLTKGEDLQENKEALEKMILRFDKVACKKQQASFAEAELEYNKDGT